MSPLTRCRASEGRIPNAMMAAYYAQRAPARIIFSETTSVTRMGVGYPDTPGIWSAEEVEGWKQVSDAMHNADGKILLQLWHVGRISHPFFLNGALPVAPSAIAAKGELRLEGDSKAPNPVPRALELMEIPGLIHAYRRAAENALEAGFKRGGNPRRERLFAGSVLAGQQQQEGRCLWRFN